MIRDTFFNTPRFVNLCRKEMVENWRSNVLRMVLMYGVMTVVMIWNGYFEYRNGVATSAKDDPAWSFVLVSSMWGLSVFGCLSASFTMERMKTKTGRLSVLMTPATSFEKFFSRWFVSTVVFLVVFLIAFKMADYTRVLVYSLKYPEISQIASTPFSHFIEPVETSRAVADYYLFSSARQFAMSIAYYFFFQSLFVLGSSIWPKNAFIKTFVAGVVIIIIYVLLGTAMSELLFKEGYFYFSSEPSLETIHCVIMLSAILATIVNWILAYVRFKESEIINRM